VRRQRLYVLGAIKGILLVHTGNTSWTPRKLKSFLDTWSIDKILQTEGITDLSAADCAQQYDYELVAA
jgi:hypothetical protein